MQPFALDNDGFAIIVDFDTHGAEGSHGGHIVTATQKTAYGSGTVCNGTQHDGAVRDGFIARNGDLTPDGCCRFDGYGCHENSSIKKVSNNPVAKLLGDGKKLCQTLGVTMVNPLTQLGQAL